MILFFILEAIYVIYILRYYKTTHSFIIPENDNIQNLFSGNYIKHNTYNTDTPEHHICKFGRDVSLIIGLYLFVRVYYIYNNKKWNWTLNKLMVFIIFICSFMNMNAVVYLIPFFIFELYIINSKKILLRSSI